MANGLAPLFLAAFLAAVLLCGCSGSYTGPRLTVTNETLAEVDSRIFGQFLERASWGEPGPEAALLPGTHTLDPRVVTLMKHMKIPLLRFPGGSDVDYIDWRDMVSNAPGREGKPRPTTVGHTGGRITNRFGLDEFLALCDELDSQPLLVVKVLAAVRDMQTLEQVAYEAAAYVAYCNAPLGVDLPGDLEKWPRLRARNGHPAPYGVKLWQAGNELWIVQGKVQREEHLGLDTPQKAADRYAECLTAVIDRMKQVDPSITILMDGPRREDSVLARLSKRPGIRRRVEILTHHAYAPGPMQQPDNADPNQFGDADWWRVFVAMPGEYDPNGQCVAFGDVYRQYTEMCKTTGVTEWNWNGWGERKLKPRPGFDPLWAAGVGSAGFLHGLIRNAAHVKLANQSLLVGRSWGITAIRVDPDGNEPPGLLPTGVTTMLSARNHGRWLVRSELGQVPTVPVDLRIGWATPPGTVALLDAVTTADEGRLYLHVINRSWDRDLPLRVTLKGLGTPRAVTRYGWQAQPRNSTPFIRDLTDLLEGEPVKVDPTEPTLHIPARSVNVYVWDLKQAGGASGSLAGAGLREATR
ncbi:MAG: hypothetical protein ACLFV7_00155 [Phycisphaerae bacterium]